MGELSRERVFSMTWRLSRAFVESHETPVSAGQFTWAVLLSNGRDDRMHVVVGTEEHAPISRRERKRLKHGTEEEPGGTWARKRRVDFQRAMHLARDTHGSLEPRTKIRVSISRDDTSSRAFCRKPPFVPFFRFIVRIVDVFLRICRNKSCANRSRFTDAVAIYKRYR